MLHRSVGVLIESTDGHLLIHRRSLTKDIHPGWWDIAAGGVVGAGESYDVAAQRELAEELGVEGVPLETLGMCRYEAADLRTYLRLYRVTTDGPFVFADGEVDEATFVAPAELNARLSLDRFMPDSVAVGIPFVARPSSHWASTLVAQTVAAFEARADAEKAGPMAACMKHRCGFLGLAAPTRRAAQREAWTPLGPPGSTTDLVLAARAFGALEHREYMYAACDLLARFERRLDDASLLVDHIEPLLTTRPWWDSVDGFIGSAVGPLVRRFPELVDVVYGWSESGDRWLIRASILHQLHSGEATDELRLFELCRRHAPDREFFVAKAIGWALRTHARQRPDSVRRFVASTALQPLSKREALKHLAAEA